MRFTVVILSALFCLSIHAEEISLDDKSDQALVEAAEKLVQEDSKSSGGESSTRGEKAADESSAVAASGAVAGATVPANAKESEIPVFTASSKKEEKASKSVVWRVLISLGLVAVVGGALVYSTKRWGKQKNKGGEKARIEFLHQYHMGPRKSLALIRVAGEVMLVGITEHNINLIKPVALIDDELEGLMGKDFNNFLEDDFSVEDLRSAVRSTI